MEASHSERAGLGWKCKVWVRISTVKMIVTVSKGEEDGAEKELFRQNLTGT